MTHQQEQEIFDLSELEETLSALENTINPTPCEVNLRTQTVQLIEYVKLLNERK